jgi:hypothetical protein
MYQIKLSETTAARRRIPVLLVDLTDGYTPKTGQTAPTVTISKNGATAVSGTGTWTEIANGQYFYEFAAGEVDTLGWIAVNVQKTACRQYNAIVQVMAYDYASGSNLGLTNLDQAVSTRLASASYTAAPAATAIADAVLIRNIATGSDGDGSTSERTVRSALRAMRNKVAVSSGVMTVYKEDDVTTGWTATLSNTANVTVDPA